MQIWRRRIKPKLDSKLAPTFEFFSHLGVDDQFIGAALDGRHCGIYFGYVSHIKVGVEVRSGNSGVTASAVF